MKKAHVLTATAGLVLALAGASFAALRTPVTAPGDNVNTVRTYGDRDESNPPSGRNFGHEAYARGNSEPPYLHAPWPNLPYGGRPYDEPNSW